MATIGCTISSYNSEYLVEQILGRGAFGTVALCKKKLTNNFVAVKILKNKKAIAGSMNEAKFLCLMKLLGSHQFNIVQWTTSFMAGDIYCLEFERLDISLREYVENYLIGLKEIRPILQQMAEALSFLKAIGIIHADLKPDNIMMVNHVHQPLKVKIIDFGLAHNNPERLIGSLLGSLYYRAPEVLLGAPYSHAIDTWALGCITVEMLLGVPLLMAPDEAEMMRLIVSMIGQPPDLVIDFGVYTRNYFTKDTTDPTRTWCLKSADVADRPENPMNTLNDLLKLPTPVQPEDLAVKHDGETFVNLITKMLDVNHCNRIAPSDILRHPFLTLGHLDRSNSSYAQVSTQLMRICPNWLAEEEEAACCSETCSETSVSDQDAGKSKSWECEHHPQCVCKKRCTRSDWNSLERKRRKVIPCEEKKPPLQSQQRPFQLLGTARGRGGGRKLR